MRIDGFWGDYNLLDGRTWEGGEKRDSSHPQATLSHERKRKKKTACCVRNDKRGVAQNGRGKTRPTEKKKQAPAVAVPIVWIDGEATTNRSGVTRRRQEARTIPVEAQ